MAGATLLAAGVIVVIVVPGGEYMVLAGTAGSADTVADLVVGRFGGKRVFHHTADDAVASIERHGLRPETYATPNGTLSPLQAHIELALPGNAPRNAVIQIDVQGLRNAGYAIPEVTRVSSRFGMPGGGFEMEFPYTIPPQFLNVVQP